MARWVLGLVLAGTVWAQTGGDVVLPRVEMRGGKPLMEALGARKTGREFAGKKLPVEVLSRLLWAGYGVNRPATGGRTSPSAHNWQVIEVYVALEEALYRYEAAGHRLVRVAGVDAREITGTQDFVAGAPLNLVYVARMDKMKASAEDTAADLAEWAAIEAGSVSQNVSLFCASEGLASVVRVGVQREKFARVAGLRGTDRIVMAHTVGYPR